MKLPASIGQKKMKAIEQVLEELGIGKVMIRKVMKAIHEEQVVDELGISTVISHIVHI